MTNEPFFVDKQLAALNRLAELVEKQNDLLRRHIEATEKLLTLGQPVPAGKEKKK